MKYRLAEYTEAYAASAASGGGAWLDVGAIGADGLSIAAVITDATPSAKVFASTDVSVANDTATITAHGFLTGLKGQLTTSGTLPTGLSLATDYFIIRVDADTVKFATSLVNAQAGTAVNITAQGSGNDTFTPTALAGNTIILQQANNRSYPVNYGVAVTATGTVGLSIDRPQYRYARAYIALTAGTLSASLQVLARGDKDA